MTVSGYQFAHLECHSRGGKGGKSVSYILSEARRDLDAVPHVPSPAPPELVHGMDVSDLERYHNDLVADAKTTYKDGRTQKISSLQQTLMSAVFSHPATMEQVRSSPEISEQVQRWEQATIKWLKATYGEQLKTVIRHTDEPHAHLHAYIVPDGLKAKELHPGHKAKAEIKNAGITDADRASAKAKQDAEPDEAKRKKLTPDTMLNRRGDTAYKNAMREWQDSYYESVGIPCGLARLGPGRRRLTREQWKAEQSQAKALSIAQQKATEFKSRFSKKLNEANEKMKADLDMAETMKAEVENLKRELLEQVEKAKQEKDIAEKIRQENEKLKSKLKQQEIKAKQIVSNAEKKAESITSVGSLFRSTIDSFRYSSIEKEIEDKFQQKERKLKIRIKEKDDLVKNYQKDYHELKREKDSLINKNNSLEDLVRELKQSLKKYEPEPDNREKVRLALQLGKHKKPNANAKPDFFESEPSRFKM